MEFEKYGGYILAFNGGKIIDYKSKQVIFEQVLPSKELSLLYDFAKKSEIEIISYDNDSIITENSKDKYVEIEAQINKMRVIEVENFLDTITFTVT